MIPSMALIATNSGAGGGGGGALDTQTVTSGGIGTAGSGDRERGYDLAGLFGSISDGTSNIYSGAAITAFKWSENSTSHQYILSITGATNSGWTSVTLSGGASTRTLNRVDATFVSGTWTWATTDTGSGNAFSPTGSVITAAFN